jgi:uncharacterized protein YheU (UPF0270 family)
MSQTLFQFLGEVNEELARIANQAANHVWEDPRTTLIQGRLFGEQLAKTVSQLEKAEPVYAIKQIERLHILSREGIVTDEVRDRFEWLRMNGNMAVHDTKDIPIDLALTAHRCIFELAKWYVETYGPISIKVPEYQMPVNRSQSVEQVPELAAEQIREQLEKIVLDKLEEKLLPSLDERFRDLQETLIRLADRKDPDINSDITPDIKNESKIEISDYLRQQGMNVIDKRPVGGALWVVGGWELKDTLAPLRKYHCYFRFARNGSQSTKRKPAWFLLGKDPEGKRWISIQQEDKNQSAIVEQVEVAVTKEEEKTDVSRVVEENTVNMAEQKTVPEIEDHSQGDDQQGDAILVPEVFRSRLIADFSPSKISDISQSMGIVTFGDWNERRLHDLFQKQPKLLHDVLVQLWFFGFRFQGELGRLLNLDHEPADNLLWDLMPDIPLEDVLPPEACRLLKRFGIVQSHQLNGIPERSIQWLMKGRHEVTLQRLTELIRKTSVSTEVPIKQKSLRFHFKDYVISLSEDKGNLPISQLQFHGCQSLLYKLTEVLNIRFVSELPEDLLSLTHSLKGVGEVAVRKFFNQLAQLANQVECDDEQNRSHPLKVQDSGFINWQETELRIEIEGCNMELTQLDFPSTPKLIEEMEKVGIKRVGDLPCHFSDLLQLPGVGKVAVTKFYNQLLLRIQDFRRQREHEQNWRGLSHDQRIHESIKRLEDLWKPWLHNSVVECEDRDLQILRYRWEKGKNGRRATLEETGEAFGITRERVRQIVRKRIYRLQADTKELIKAIQEACRSQFGYYQYPLNPAENYSHDLIIQILESVNINYFEDFGWWSTESEEKLENTYHQFKHFLHEKYKGIFIDKDTLAQDTSALASTWQMPQQLILDLGMQWLRQVDNGKYILANSKKSDIVEMILRSYPEGVEIYKRAAELCEQANRISPDSFDKEREFTSIFGRDEFSDIAYLWGRGTYIHHSYVKPDATLLNKISEFAENLLEQRSPISVGRLYNQFYEELQQAEVPNEYALYTLLRKFGSQKLALHKFPYIWHKKDAFQLQNAELIKAFIREYNHPISIESLREEFVVRRGWKPFTLNFSISNDRDFVHADHGVVSLLEFYPLEKDDFEPFYEKLAELLSNTAVIHVNRLFKEMEPLCLRLGIQTPYLLFDLLKHQQHEVFKCIRYPLITLADQELEEATLQTLIEEFILEYGAEVSREAVFEWVVKDLGARESTLDNVLANSQIIYYYSRGQYGEYIHRDNMGWTEEKENQVINWVTNELRKAMQQRKPYKLIHELFDPKFLPILEDGIEWTEDLLLDVLKKSKKVNLLGSYDAIVALHDSSIQNETDFVEYVIKTFFLGKANLRDLYRKLSELKYSKDGQFLYETTIRIQNGHAPFFITGDQIFIKQENKW